MTRVTRVTQVDDLMLNISRDFDGLNQSSHLKDTHALQSFSQAVSFTDNEKPKLNIQI